MISTYRQRENIIIPHPKWSITSITSFDKFLVEKFGNFNLHSTSESYIFRVFFTEKVIKKCYRIFNNLINTFFGVIDIKTFTFGACYIFFASRISEGEMWQ